MYPDALVADDWRVVREKPIPLWSEPPNWARLPIREGGEPLLCVFTGEDENTTLRSLYAEAGISSATAEIRVRVGVAQRLRRAAEHLWDYEIGLVVFDGYRPLAVQQYLYDSFAADLRGRYPEMPEQELTAMLRQYVATPTADPTCPPPHLTGGAVDVYLIDRTTGLPLPMGTEPDETVPASATRWFEEHPQEPFTSNRRLLFHVMRHAGLANYYGEWWHFDWGNQRWANLAGAEAALYGIAPEK